MAVLFWCGGFQRDRVRDRTQHLLQVKALPSLWNSAPFVLQLLRFSLKIT